MGLILFLLISVAVGALLGTVISACGGSNRAQDDLDQLEFLRKLAEENDLL